MADANGVFFIAINAYQVGGKALFRSNYFALNNPIVKRLTTPMRRLLALSLLTFP